jgi:hypothetical protein
MNFMVIWYIFPLFGMLYQEKSGNLAIPAASSRLNDWGVRISADSLGQIFK